MCSLSRGYEAKMYEASMLYQLIIHIHPIFILLLTLDSVHLHQDCMFLVCL